MNARRTRRAAERSGPRRLSAVVVLGLALGAGLAGATASKEAQQAAADSSESAEATAERAARGAEIFARRCAPCHGEEGRGDGPAAEVLDPRPRDFTDPEARVSENDAELRQVITEGGPALELSSAMPAWGKILSREQIGDLVAYVRTLGDEAKEKAKAKDE